MLGLKRGKKEGKWQERFDKENIYHLKEERSLKMAIDISKYKVDPKKLSKEEMDEALRLLEAKRIRKARVDAGELKGYGVSYKDMTPEQKEKAKKYARRRLIRQNLLIAKAEAMGVTVSDAEVDAEMAKKKA